MSGRVGLRQRFKHKLFYLYTAYGYCGPLLIITIAWIADNIDLLPEKYRPGIGEDQCFLSGKSIKNKILYKFLTISTFSDESVLYYLYSITITIMVVNITLFSITAYRIHTIKKEAVKNPQNSRRHSHNNPEREK